MGTLYYQKGMRSDSATMKVKVLEGSPPSVTVKEQRYFKENVDRTVVVRGNIKSKIGNMRVWVECVDEDGYSFVDLEDPDVLRTAQEATGVRRGRLPVAMVFNKNVLESGVSYKFRFNAEHSGGHGYSETVITTNAAPTIGVLSSDKTNGTALSDQFTLSAVDGWEDDVNDQPLLYSFGYYSAEGDKKYLGSPSTGSEITRGLPAGDSSKNHQLVAFVEVSDVYGSMSETELVLTVMPPTKVDAAAVEDLQSAIEDTMKNDPSAAIGLMTSALDTYRTNVPEADADNMDASGIEEIEATNGKIFEMQESVSNNVLAKVDDMVDLETQKVLIGALGDMTEGGDQFQDDTKATVVVGMTSIVKSQTGGAQAARRRRSSEDSAAADSGNVYSVEDVNSILVPYKNVISASLSDDASMANKKNFTDTTIDIMKSMCKGIAFGQDAILSESSLADIQTVKILFSNESSGSVDLDCGAKCDVPTKLIVGASLEEKYSSYTCGDETCAGACVGSVNYNSDLFSTDIRTTLLTDIVSLSLYEPEQNEVLFPGTLSTKLQLQLPLKNQADSKYYYVCDFWNSASSSWSSDTCVAQTDTLVLGSQSYAVCECSELGTVRVTAGEARPVPSTTPSATTTASPEAPSTAAATTTQEPAKVTTKTPKATTTKKTKATEKPVPTKKPTPKPTGYKPPMYDVTLRFDADYDQVIQKVGSKEKLEQAMRTSIASSLNVEEARVVEVECTRGSIITTFMYLPPEDETNSTRAVEILNADMKKLQKDVEAGNFKVNINGLSESISVEKNQKFEPKFIAGEKGQSKNETESNLLPLWIVLGVVGGLGLIAIIAFVAIKYGRSEPVFMV